jgi:hypothetical protein
LVDSAEDADGGRELDGQILDLEEGHGLKTS